MKYRSLAFFTLVLTPFFVLAQNPMFNGWGMSKTVVSNNISKITSAELHTEKSNPNVLASFKNANFSYTFNRTSLYEISMEKTFYGKKAANQSYDNCLAYFSTVRAQVVAHTETDKELEEYVFAVQGRVYWLSIRRFGKKMSQISLIGRDLTRTPLEMWSELEHKVAQNIGLGEKAQNIPLANAGN